MKTISLCLLASVGLTSGLFAQRIVTPTNTALSLSNDLNLLPNRSILVGGAVYLKLPSSGGTNATLGLGAGASNLSGTQNLFLGADAGNHTNATANVFVGYRAGYRNTSGTFNTFLGVQAGYNNTSGASNVMMGTNSGLSNTTGRGNYFLGDNAGGQNTSGSYNIYIGTNAGNGAGVNGNNNAAIGFEAGRNNQAGQTNTFLGFRADAGSNGLVNATAIGADAKVNQSNSLVLGNNTNVGIGTSAPSARLEVNSGQANVAGLKLTSLTSRSVPTVNTAKFLTVDNAGNVILANYAGGGRVSAPDSTADLWQRTGAFLRTRQGEGLIVGTGVQKTPAGYSLFVGQGILTEKVRVSIKNSTDWSDRVFEPGYPLPRLSSVRDYVQQHKHLPGLPSADDVVEQGIDVGRMDALLLEKIEELTLYNIQLEQTVRQQQQALRRLMQQQNRLEQAFRKATYRRR